MSDASALSDTELDRLLAEGLGPDPIGWVVIDQVDQERLWADTFDEANDWNGEHLDWCGKAAPVFDPYSADPAASARLRTAVLNRGMVAVVAATHRKRRPYPVKDRPFFCVVCPLQGIRIDPDPEWVELQCRGVHHAWAATEARAVAEAVLEWLLAEGKVELL